MQQTTRVLHLRPKDRHARAFCFDGAFRTPRKVPFRLLQKHFDHAASHIFKSSAQAKKSYSPSGPRLRSCAQLCEQELRTTSAERSRTVWQFHWLLDLVFCAMCCAGTNTDATSKHIPQAPSCVSVRGPEANFMSG